jgi:hypothetical protein
MAPFISGAHKKLGVFKEKGGDAVTMIQIFEGERLG